MYMTVSNARAMARTGTDGLPSMLQTAKSPRQATAHSRVLYVEDPIFQRVVGQSCAQANKNKHEQYAAHDVGGTNGIQVQLHVLFPLRYCGFIIQREWMGVTMQNTFLEPKNAKSWKWRRRQVVLAEKWAGPYDMSGYGSVLLARVLII